VSSTGTRIWPALDVDVSIASIEHPEHYPLRAKR
jgi:hypothetical protein